MDKIKPLLVLLTCDFKDEKLCEIVKEIVAGFPLCDHEHAKQVQIVNCTDIFGECKDDAPLPPEEALKKLQKLMKPPTKEHDAQVYLLHDYPLSVGHLIGLVENSKDYSIFDGIVKVVSKPDGKVKSSMHGPETTVTEVPPVVVIDNEDRALSKFDVDSVLQACKASRGGLWVDITYDEFNIMHRNTFTNAMEDMGVPLMIDQLADLTLHMCSLKSEFKDWNSKKTKTKLVTDAAAIKRIKAAVSCAACNEYDSAVWKDTHLYESYLNTLNHIPRKVRNVGAVLYSIIDAVSHDLATVTACDNEAPAIPEQFKGLGLDDGSIGSTGEKPFHMLKQGYNVAVQNLQSNAFTVHEGDYFHSRIINAKDILLKNDDSDAEYIGATAVFGFERDAVFTGHVPRLIGQGGMPLHASIPLKDRNIQETELLTFTALSTFDFHRYNQLIYFNRMVNRGVPPRVDFTGLRRSEDGGGDISALKRKYFKNIPAFTLPQIFAKELLKEPVVSREYYPLTDELLVCFYWPPPKRRMEKKSWNPANNMHLRPNFEQFLVLSERMNFTPRTAASVHNCLDIPTAEMQKYGEETVFITPADKSVVLVKESSSAKKAWVTIHSNDLMFGLRQLISPTMSEDSSEGMFFLQTEDDVRTSVTVGASAEMCVGKPDQNGTVCLTMLFPDELRVSACSNGTVTISSPTIDPTEHTTVKILDGKSPSKSPNSRMLARVQSIEKGTALMAPEVKRLVCNAGCIIRCLDVGGPFVKDIYFPDGRRVLIRDMTNIDVENPEDRLPTFKYPVSGIMETILLEAPVVEGEDGPMEWTYVVLDQSGRVLYSFDDYNAENGPETDRVMHLSTVIPNISNYYVDAETEALVTEFRDGRVICISTDDLQDVYFPEGTRVTTHPSGEMIFIDRTGHPKLEIDAEIDVISRRHAQGFTVPIAKGGDKTRTKMAMPDGTAILIKYDTRITSTYNGSVKAVRRDKSIVYAVDGGIVNFISSGDWNNRAIEEFEEEKKDAENKARVTPLLNRNRTAGTKRSVHIRTMNESAQTLDETGTSANFESAEITMAQSMGVPEKTPGKKKKFTRRKPKKLEQLGLSSSPRKPQDIAEEEKPIIEPKSTAAKYSFDLNVCQCVIEDHENNVFDIDLEDDPTTPLVSLAGEVDGCKPNAVAATNIEPRLFVVRRSADATEICRYEEIEELDNAFRRSSSDYVKYTSDVLCPPCNLGGSVQHSFFWHRKMQSTSGFTFSDIFAERPWAARPRPAALSVSLRKQHSRFLTAEDERTRRQQHEVFITKTYIESAPLSDEGYTNVADDINRWEQFRRDRDKTELTFAIEDHRTETEKNDESDIMKKLKSMYKSHKAQKKKEAERNKSVLATPGDLPVIEEGTGDQDDEFDAASRDEEDDEPTPEEIELNDAFDTFAVKDPQLTSTDESISDSIAGVLDLQSLQNVFVQVFNRFITFQLLSDAYYDDTGLPLDEGDEITFDYDMFRRMHYHLQTRFTEEDVASQTASLASCSLAKSIAPGDNNFNGAATSEGIRVDFSGLGSRGMSETGMGGSERNSARGSGVMAVRNMSKTIS